MFDSYLLERACTKEPEQKRRRHNKTSSADIVLTRSTAVSSDKEAFLCNKQNEQQILNMLDKFLSNAGIEVRHAGDEGDADVIIVKTALEMVTAHDNVQVVCDDTDVLILLLYHHNTDVGNIFLLRKRLHININAGKYSIGTMCDYLPFVHAVSGCDTTSALFGIGKVKHLKNLQSSGQLRSSIDVFGEELASKEHITAAGEIYISSLYKGGKTNKCLDALRLLIAVSPKYVSPQRMPPTSSACYYHSIRVHLQVNSWKKLQTVLDSCEYGFYKDGNTLSTVITNKDPAPGELLKDFHCACKRQEKPCISCSCSKMRISCSLYCKCQGDRENGKHVQIHEVDEDEDD